MEQTPGARSVGRAGHVEELLLATQEVYSKAELQRWAVTESVGLP